MKLLFDQGTPAPLRHHLADHSVDTLAEKGWSNKGNGELLDLAEREEYEILVTTDQNLRYQQNLNPIVAKTAGFCSDSGAGVQNGEGMTQVSFESCVTVH